MKVVAIDTGNAKINQMIAKTLNHAENSEVSFSPCNGSQYVTHAVTKGKISAHVKAAHECLSLAQKKLARKDIKPTTNAPDINMMANV